MNNQSVETTVIAAHTLLKGELHLSGPAVIRGRVEGAIFTQEALEIAAEGQVEGDITGIFIDIQGSVKGNVTASEACRLGPTARVAGELRASNMALAEGACFVGQVHVGGANANTELSPEASSPPPSSSMAVNRMQSITHEVEEIAHIASSAPAPEAAIPTMPAVRVIPQTVQQTLQRMPKIIKAR